MLKALVVDDNEVNTMILANMLEQFNISANVASSGDKALHFVERYYYDMIFIDHIMPKMDGIQTTRAIRAIYPDKQKTIIIALTSNVTDKLKFRYRMAGANDIFCKPLELEGLTTIIKQWFNDLDFIYKEKKDYQCIDPWSRRIRAMLSNVEEIDYEDGLMYALGSATQYINILKVACNDLSANLESIGINIRTNSEDDLRNDIHKLKNILTSIGALGLLKSVSELYNEYDFTIKKTVTKKCLRIEMQLKELLTKLHRVLDQYDAMIKNEKEKQETPYPPITDSEYEQCLTNTIYYIKRFEYDSIVKSLELLIERDHSDNRKELQLVLYDIQEFNYDGALNRILSIKKGIDAISIPEN